MPDLPPYLPLPAALIWIGSRDEQATVSAISLRSDLAVATALVASESIGIWNYAVVGTVWSPCCGVSLERGKAPRLALEFALQRGRVKAFGDDGSGVIGLIPPQEWVWISIGLNSRVGTAGDDRRSWKRTTVCTSDLLTVFPPIGRAASEVSGELFQETKRPRHGDLKKYILQEIDNLRNGDSVKLGRNEAAELISDNLKKRRIHASSSYVRSLLTQQGWTQ